MIVNTTKRTKPKQSPTLKNTARKSLNGKYSSVEVASLAKMESAKDFIATIDLTLIRASGHVK